MVIEVYKPKESYKKQNRRDLHEALVYASHASAIRLLFIFLKTKSYYIRLKDTFST